MSNHYHAVVTDKAGVLPAFLARFHRHLAMVLNARRERFENFWSTDQTSVVLLVEDSDLVDKVVYALANPVAAHLVDRTADWPGASSLRLMAPGCSAVAKRPGEFFRQGGPMPESVTIAANCPRHWTAEKWFTRVLQALASAEATIMRNRAPLGHRPAVPPNARAASPEPRRKLRPIVACRNLVRRLVELASFREFRMAYARVRRRWVAGDRDVVFPAGTYFLRVVHGVPCALPPAPS